MKNDVFNDETTAWEKFITTGSVNDYLSYSLIKKRLHLKGKQSFEDQYRGTSDIGTNNWGI